MVTTDDLLETLKGIRAAAQDGTIPTSQRLKQISDEATSQLHNAGVEVDQLEPCAWGQALLVTKALAHFNAACEIYDGSDNWPPLQEFSFRTDTDGHFRVEVITGPANDHPELVLRVWDGTALVAIANTGYSL